MMKNKNMMIAATLGAILLVGGIVFWVFSGGLLKGENEVIPEVEEQVYETVTPESLGLTLTVRPDKKAVTMQMTKLSGITMVDYELSYLAAGDIPRGVIGSIQLNPSDTVISRELLLGTCSRNVCKYDEGVTSVKLVVKITKSDGNIYQSELSQDL